MPMPASATTPGAAGWAAPAAVLLALVAVVLPAPGSAQVTTHDSGLLNGADDTVAYVTCPGGTRPVACQCVNSAGVVTNSAADGSFWVDDRIVSEVPHGTKWAGEDFLHELWCPTAPAHGQDSSFTTSMPYFGADTCACLSYSGQVSGARVSCEPEPAPGDAADEIFTVHARRAIRGSILLPLPHPGGVFSGTAQVVPPSPFCPVVDGPGVTITVEATCPAGSTLVSGSCTCHSVWGSSTPIQTADGCRCTDNSMPMATARCKQVCTDGDGDGQCDTPTPATDTHCAFSNSDASADDDGDNVPNMCDADSGWAPAAPMVCPNGLLYVPSLGTFMRLCDPGTEDCSAAQFTKTMVDGTVETYVPADDDAAYTCAV